MDEQTHQQIIATVLVDSDTVMSVLLTKLQHGHKIGELHTCASIDIQAAPSTPLGEGLGVNVHADHPNTISHLMLETLLSILEPILVRGGKLLTINEHLPKQGIVLWLVPDHADDVNLTSHRCKHLTG